MLVVMIIKQYVTQFAKTWNNPANQYFQYKLSIIKLSIRNLNLQGFNRGDNWAVVTPIYKNWVPSCSLSHEQFKYFCAVSVF